MSLMLVNDHGAEIRLPLARWLAEPDEIEQRLLALVQGPAIDIGCGPGRLVLALARRGIASLGVDISERAVSLARARGAQVLHRSVFEPIPGQARWASVLLLDGNIGIGGEPAALLLRVKELLAPAGRVFVEVEPPHNPSRKVTARLVSGEEVSEAFPWAHVSIVDLPVLAAGTQMSIERSWAEGDRHFAVLRSA